MMNSNSEDDDINLIYDKGFIYEILLLKYKSYFSRLISVNTTFRIIISVILFILTSLPYYKSEYIPPRLLSVVFLLLFLMVLTWITQKISLQLNINRLEKSIFRREENKSRISDFYKWFFHLALKAKRIRNLLSLTVVVEPIFWFLIAFFIFNLNTNYLQSNNYRNKDFVGFDFTNQELQKVNFTGSLLTKANLSQANLSQAILREIDLGETDLSRAILREVDLRKSNLSRANLSQANLSRANLSQANLSQANLSQADLTETVLFQANLSQANLTETDLGEVNFIGSLLIKANLTEANLFGADLEAANLRGAIFCRTTMPDGVINNKDCDS